MKKYIILLIPLIIGCSFQVRESEGYEEMASRRPSLEERDVYSEFNPEEGFNPYDYEETLPTSDYKIEDRERFSRRTFFLDDIDESRNIEREIYGVDAYYQRDELNYKGAEEEPEILKERKVGENTLKLDIFK